MVQRIGGRSRGPRIIKQNQIYAIAPLMRSQYNLVELEFGALNADRKP
jgi:hypothetical protein